MGLVETVIIAVAFLCAACALYMYLRERKRANTLREVMDAVNDAVLITDESGTIIDINAAFCNITGYERDELIGENPSIMKSDRHPPEFYAGMWESLKTEGTWFGEIWDRHKNGEDYPKLLTINAIKPAGETLYVGVFRDATEAKQTEEQFDYLMSKDHLTGLPNRRSLLTMLVDAMRTLDEHAGMAITTMNILRFKSINEAFGFAGGDQLLKELAKRMSDLIQGRGHVGRTGSDEFTFLLYPVDDEKDVQDFVNEVLRSLEEFFFIKSQYIYVGIYMGSSMYPKHGNNPETLQTYSKKALAKAKEKGINSHAFFVKPPERDLVDLYRVENNLRYALKHNEMVLYYQAQNDMKTGKVYGAEALIRRVESGWVIGTGQFIVVAEETGLIKDICEWSLIEGCKQHKMWVAQGLPPVRIAINATALQFSQGTIVHSVKNAIATTGIDPKYLEIEVTERAFMGNAAEIIGMLHELKALGIELALDDFGTGYSSLGYLSRFPLNSVKIDISFVRQIGKSREGETIVDTIINLSHSLGFKALAEGVETKEQLDYLIRRGCDQLQGFYFSMPLTAEKFAEELAAGRNLFDVEKGG